MDPYRVFRDHRAPADRRVAGDGVILWVLLAAGVLTVVGAREGDRWGAAPTVGLLVGLFAATQLLRHAWTQWRSRSRRSERKDSS